ncbi:MAG: tRNA (N6-threonylcarbamoyladenosine(37)-N6)-methyltransferase TrmO [Proteobacteria bacterium]|nr:tRNA (N6-threonylcarbamoyladenosine(37)-N6)-methyltransferase TrmO [Pseudomonadota bacterium]MBU1687827.1 tRNA (N6-threonylcarbamoyladenosine(37)-N6)-methyltransferase TrmO [Pseudomonadota bacterium]
MNPITLSPIGRTRCQLKTRDETPKNYTDSNEPGTLVIDPQYLDALDRIEVGQTIVVLFWLHEARRDLLKVYPRGDRSRGLHGVFATRSPMRPNPIALSELKVTAIRGNEIDVLGIDVLDGTPILDIKKSIGPDAK